MRLNLPLALTLFRLIFSVLFLPIVLVEVLSKDLLVGNVIVACIFLMVSLTDFLDGYFARKYDQITVLGKILDPIADKVLLLVGLSALLSVGRVPYWFVILLLAREFMVMGLRLVAKDFEIDIPVSTQAKQKTLFQMITLSYLIAFSHFSGIGFLLKGVLMSWTLFFSLGSALNYGKQVFYRLKKKKLL